MSRMCIGLAFTAMLFAAGCGPGGIEIDEEQIAGPYRLRTLAGPFEPHICYLRASGACDQRIEGRVIAVAHDEDFVSAAIYRLNIASAKEFYYIVRDFDGPRADMKRAVRGPFTEEKFRREMEEHGVPAPLYLLPPA